MITNELVNKSIDYIIEHLDEEITIEDVANHCHFSKYYFSRMFKAATGESVYSFIKRGKMEQSAIKLKIERDKTITDIGFDYGYSPSNYSSAFKKHHDISPIEFRKNVRELCIPHPFHPNEYARFKSFEEYDSLITIRELDDIRVIYERRIGNYIDLKEDWCEFSNK